MQTEFKARDEALETIRAFAPRITKHYTSDQIADQYIDQQGVGVWVVKKGVLALDELKLRQGENVVVLNEHDRAQIAREVEDRQGANAVPKGYTDEDLASYCGYSHCPNKECGIQLSNGVCDFENMIDVHGSESAAYKHQKHEFSCLACGTEWGEVITPKGSRGSATRHYTDRSDMSLKEKGGAVHVCHDLYTANPGLRRKDAIQLAVDAGVAFYTARTQYQKWFKARKAAAGAAQRAK